MHTWEITGNESTFQTVHRAGHTHRPVAFGGVPMNIFVLDLQPRAAAQAHMDKHVVKMILEYAQLLCAAHHLVGEPLSCMYKLTHANHPCTKWVCMSAANYRWLYALFCELGREYTHRYGKVHKSVQKLSRTLVVLPTSMRNDAHLQSYDVENFALAMPDEYKDLKSAVQSYRAYYMGAKRKLASWTNRNQPEWWK